MAVFGKRRELNEWAQALGVTNDVDAMGALRRLMNELDEARSVLQRTTPVLADVPDADAQLGAAGAMTAIENASAHLLQVERRFARHERGRA